MHWAGCLPEKKKGLSPERKGNSTGARRPRAKELGRRAPVSKIKRILFFFFVLVCEGLPGRAAVSC